MKKVKILFTSLLLLLFLTNSCSIGELRTEPSPYSSEILKNVNPAFLEHDLSVYKISPIWNSVITFNNVNAIEVNFTIDKKHHIPLSENQKIRGRQRLLLKFENGKIKETIIEYIPSDNFTGDIKEINSSNFKSKQFDGKITFKHPNESSSIVWVLSKGIVTKKLKRTETVSKQKKMKKMAASIEICAYREVSYEVCLENGGGEVVYCWTDFKLVEECVLVDSSDSGVPGYNGDSYDCNIDSSWPWCQDGGNNGAGGNSAGDKAQAIEDQIDDSKLDPCPKEVLNKLKNTTVCDITNVLTKLGANTIYNVKIQSGNSGGFPANTVRNGINDYTVTVSNDHYTSSTDLFKASNILHEVIHAFFMSLIDDYTASQNPSVFNEFPALFQKFVDTKYPGSKEDAHHEEMANFYVDAIGAALQEFQTGVALPNGVKPNQLYTDLAWGGLSHAPIYDKYFFNKPQEKSRIENRYSCESNGGTAGSGTPSQQTAIGKPCK